MPEKKRFTVRPNTITVEAFYLEAEHGKRHWNVTIPGDGPAHERTFVHVPDAVFQLLFEEVPSSPPAPLPEPDEVTLDDAPSAKRTRIRRGRK